jgi:hypothetical protein
MMMISNHTYRLKMSPGKEGAVEAHQQEVQHGKVAEPHPGLAHAQRRKQCHGQAGQAAEQHHRAAECVGHEGNAEGGGPVAGLHHEYPTTWVR